jgi:hypothetical protein
MFGALSHKVGAECPPYFDDQVIGCVIGLSVHELVTASVELAGHSALGGFLSVF